MERRPIGVIHTPYSTKEEAPIQGRFCPEGEGRVELLPEYADGLKDIEGFSHLFLLYWFDRAGEVELVRPTLCLWPKSARPPRLAEAGCARMKEGKRAKQ